jgi:fatty acid desaturase
MPEFGKIHIGYGWIIMKVLLISLSIILLFTPIFWIAASILIYFYYSIVHEFIHLAAIKKHGGLLDKMFLGYPRSYIDFKMPSVEAERAVFGWGAAADIIVMITITSTLFFGSIITDSDFLRFLAVMFAIVFVLTELMPKHSDLQEYSARFQKV